MGKSHGAVWSMGKSHGTVVHALRLGTLPQWSVAVTLNCRRPQQTGGRSEGAVR